MNTRIRSLLVFHGGAVIMLGMLSGIPLAMVILGELSGSTSDWKLSHMEGLLNGLLMLAIAACGHLLSLSEKQAIWLYRLLLITGYGNGLYGWVRGITGEAGLNFLPPFGNQLAAFLGGFPIFTAFTLIILMMISARKNALAEM